MSLFVSLKVQERYKKGAISFIVTTIYLGLKGTPL